METLLIERLREEHRDAGGRLHLAPKDAQVEVEVGLWVL